MITTACAEDWREMYNKAAREAREWQENFNVLQRALVGETGASGIEIAHALRKDAERYRKWRAAFTSERDEDVMHKLADAWEPEAVDAVLDAAPAVGAA